MKLSALILIAAALGTQAGNAHGQRRTFEIMVSIVQDSLKQELYRQHGMFWVDAKIRNISNKDQQIIVWSQSGWSWLSGNPGVHPEIAAQQNVSRTIVIKPGQTYGQRVDVTRFPRGNGTITFRLGFYPKANLPISPQPSFAKLHENEIAWSNALTLAQ